MLNRIDPTTENAARVRYLEADYKIDVPGAFVVCAVTGERIPLDELKYWSWERQEAYIDHHAALAAELKARSAG